ncbi:MAG: hypothetical protein KZQ83_14810 [gamma proteobacterium symbiont of Taylorina sp.]|nr:hypothetical protein [gamma proteobacterium symbiont of Taylorina sp.]
MSKKNVKKMGSHTKKRRRHLSTIEESRLNMMKAEKKLLKHKIKQLKGVCFEGCELMDIPKGFIQATTRQCSRSVNHLWRLGFDLESGEVVRLAIDDDSAFWLRDCLNEFIELRKLVPNQRNHPELPVLLDRNPPKATNNDHPPDRLMQHENLNKDPDIRPQNKGEHHSGIE